MGNWLSACCKGQSRHQDTRIRTLLNLEQGRSKDRLYEPALAETEREAVAELLQYLENAWTPTREATALG